MPVPTDTFRSIKKLNVIFACSALALFGSTMWLVTADHFHPWQNYQMDARVWETAMTKDAMVMASATDPKIAELADKLAKLRDQLPHAQIQGLQDRIDENTREQKKLELRLAVEKGKLGPKMQLIERAVNEQGPDSERARKLRSEYAAIEGEYKGMAETMAKLTLDRTALEKELRSLRAAEADVQKQIDALARERQTLQERLAQVAPTGAAAIGEHIRNAPLSNWFNPSLKVQQVVAPDVRTDLNFLTVDTVDRCNTCHINIDNPKFQKSEILSFVSRQIAQSNHWDVDKIEGQPEVALEFWEKAAVQAGLEKGLRQVQEQTFKRVNELREQAGMKPLVSADRLAGEFADIQQRLGDDKVTRATWYRVIQDHTQAIRDLLAHALPGDDLKSLNDLHAQTLIGQYNQSRRAAGLPEVNDNPVLFAHPRLELFVGVDSKHPMLSMGCTVCHEGSGQETIFEHTAHSPREVWVDEKTGTPVPSFMVKPDGDHVASALKQGGTSALASATVVPLLAKTDDHKSQASGHASHGHAAASFHDDVNLNNAAMNSGAPFAPVKHEHADKVTYQHPTAEQPRSAIRQKEYWTRHYDWAVVHYMHWEKPMHELKYVESSCNKCHTEVFDLEKAAPKLYEGRKLFAELGCVNCHSVTDLADDLDIKKVGPDLVHVKHKLSSEMLASWIWSPKAFRPMTRMPHFFMLENNSAPTDILRTRVETAAMTHYLLAKEPGKTAQAYEPEVAPVGSGNVENGRVLFNQLGCLSCHTNMAEHGEGMILEDLMKRAGLDETAAKKQYESMSYNQRHWYAMEHLESKLVKTGPELSGVGTKLKAGRNTDQARAWLFDWLRNPRHYSSYTIMPSFRLSEEEANDMASYLLTLERPDDWKTADFMTLGQAESDMLVNLVATLKAGQSTFDIAKREVLAMNDPDHKQKLMFLGEKMIAHYGCNGCHQISGFENATSACTNLDEWGLKDPHKIDYGYFYDAFAKLRDKPAPVQKVLHEGLQADATAINAKSDQLVHKDVAWEHVENERRPWLYQKLHNPRVYDRGRAALEGRMDGGNVVDVGKPYDKLKMPKFFLKDRQAEALVTFVTSIRKPLVSQKVQQATYSADKRRWARGRQAASLYNCYGCHNIEGNDPHILHYFTDHGDGTFNELGYKWAPPRLWGQGAKTQPDWLFHFLQNVHPIRPWLKVRMPSFPVADNHGAHASALVDYFAGHVSVVSKDLNATLEPIHKFKTQNPEAAWHSAPALAAANRKLGEFAVNAGLVQPDALDPRHHTADELAETWNTLLKQSVFLADTYQTTYPYVDSPRPALSPEQFARGEKFITQLGCLAGNCHSIGDVDMLAELAALEKMKSKPAAPSADDDPYGAEEKPAKKDAKAAAPAAEDDGYGEDPPAAKSTAGRKNGKWLSAAPEGDPQQFPAPNLIRTGYRIQRRWMDHWVQQPTTILPGTWMLAFFPEGKSQFDVLPPEMQTEFHQLYGYTGEAQRQLLLDWVYAASARNYTPGAEALTGVKKPAVEIKPLEKPRELIQKEKDQPAAPATDAGTTKPQAAATPAPVVEKATSDIDLHDGEQAWTGSGQGRIVGVINFSGDAPRRRPVRMDSDPKCASQHTEPVLSQAMVVNDKGQMQWVFVRVKSGLSGTFPAPATPAVLDQHGCMYVPHVMGVMVNQPVAILNSDATLHNVNVKPTANKGFNMGMPVKGMKIEQKFSKPELGIPFKCDVHPWMGATLHVVDNPFFAVSDVEGRFEIKGLPPGTYTLEAVHESAKVPAKTFQVTVKADTSVRADVALAGQ